MPLTFLGFPKPSPGSPLPPAEAKPADAADANAPVGLICDSEVQVPVTAFQAQNTLAGLSDALRRRNRMALVQRQEIARKLRHVRSLLQSRVRKLVERATRELRLEVIQRFVELEQKLSREAHLIAASFMKDLFAHDALFRERLLARANMQASAFLARLPGGFSELQVSPDEDRNVAEREFADLIREHSLTIATNHDLQFGSIRLVGRSGALVFDWRQALLASGGARS